MPTCTGWKRSPSSSPPAHPSLPPPSFSSLSGSWHSCPSLHGVLHHEHLPQHLLCTCQNPEDDKVPRMVICGESIRYVTPWVPIPLRTNGPPWPPQLGYLQLAMPLSVHGSKWGALECRGILKTGHVWALASICGIAGRVKRAS